MNTESIKAQLRELHLKTAATELEDVLAHQKKTVPLDWLSTLLSREIDARHEARAVPYPACRVPGGHVARILRLGLQSRYRSRRHRGTLHDGLRGEK